MRTTDPIPIDDPRPGRYFTDGPGIGGRIKVRPEDFVVEEIPLYEPSGTGEHLYLRLRKRGVSHGELLGRLRRHFNVTESAIGYAGMKDKHAVTSQTVSVHLPQDPPSVELPHQRIDVLWAARHRNKIRRGHLVGNRFSIRIRDVDPLQAPAVLRRLERLEVRGVPGYFGRQRFGYRRNNHRLGAMLLREAWSAALDELLGTGGAPFPPHQQERRELYDAGRHEEAASQWSVADRAELIAANALARGGTPAEAVRAIGRTTLGFWVSALVSAAYNRVLDQRVDVGTVDQLFDGDVAWKHDSRATFAVTAATLAEEGLADRLAALELSPSGPLWGERMPRAVGDVDRVERDALAAAEVPLAQITTGRYRPAGGRRPFRAALRHVDVEGGFDEHGPHIRVAFDLPRGIYATVVLREVMRNDRDDDEA